MADVVMGFLFTHAALGRGDVGIFALLLAASTLLYAAGVVLNDVFDFAADARDRPERPLPSGRISRSVARWLGWELLALGVALAWVAAFFAGDLRPGVVGTVLAACVVLYDAALKRTPLGPPTMGACRLLNVLLGMSAAAGPWHDEHWLVAASVGTYVAGVTWLARTEAGRSSRWHLAPATVVILVGIGLLWLVPHRCDPDHIVPILRQQPGRWTLLIAVLAALIGFRCLRAVIEPVPYRVQWAVKQCILSLVILDAAACFVVRGIPGAVMVLALLVPTVALGWWIEST
jgi:4-hydroxybenzoate polyprenyltransferase